MSNVIITHADYAQGADRVPGMTLLRASRSSYEAGIKVQSKALFLSRSSFSILFRRGSHLLAPKSRAAVMSECKYWFAFSIGLLQNQHSWRLRY